MNSIQAGSFLTLHYRLCGPAGREIINTFDSKPATLTLGSGVLAAALEQCLMGLNEGDRKTFELAPGEAFGPRNPDMVQRIDRSLLNDLGNPDEEYQLGDVLQFPTPDHQGTYAGSVCAVDSQWVQFDFNHPLAGQPVSFEVHVIGVL